MYRMKKNGQIKMINHKGLMTLERLLRRPSKRGIWLLRARNQKKFKQDKWGSLSRKTYGQYCQRYLEKQILMFCRAVFCMSQSPWIIISPVLTYQALILNIMLNFNLTLKQLWGSYYYYPNKDETQIKWFHQNYIADALWGQYLKPGSDSWAHSFLIFFTASKEKRILPSHPTFGYGHEKVML